MSEKEPLIENAQTRAFAFRVKRLRQLTVAIIASLILVSFHQVYVGEAEQAQALIIFSLILCTVFWFVKNKRPDQGTTVLLTVLTLVVTYFMWRYDGIRDEALLGYPAILIFAVISGTRNLSIGLLILMIINILLIGYVNSAGIYINNYQPSTIEAATLDVIILIVVSLSIWVLSSDLKNLLEKLSHENDRVLKKQSEIEKLIHHDALTSLPNREMARERFKHALARSKRDGTVVCMMFIDLDNFKNINDSLGHASGDQLLIALSKRFVSILRETDSVCRLGGDEFLIILEKISDKFEILTLAEKILHSTKEPVDIDGNSIMISCSIGIATAPEDGDNFNDISHHADLAMYKAKDAGRNSYRYYNAHMDTVAKESISLIADLHKALPENQLFLMYQPKFDLATNKVIGAEALLRWQHPEHGLIPPDKFIPLAESSGLIIDIGSWVIEQGCRDCRFWLDQGLDDITVAVNVSSLQFKRGNIISVVLDALEKESLDGHLLELEMTESLLIDQSGELLHTLQELKKAGVKFAIDDFGTGYSNLGYLRKFEVETLKIDQSFIRNILDNSKDQALVKAIIQMARGLSMKTVAEGIETEEIMDLCAEFSCDYGQGYYWAKPLPLEEFIHYTKQSTN